MLVGPADVAGFTPCLCNAVQGVALRTRAVTDQSARYGGFALAAQRAPILDLGAGTLAVSGQLQQARQPAGGRAPGGG